jgi:trk system potassium uptake protein TrkA
MGKSIAVFGLGRFGKSIATTLYEAGADVMVVDKNPKLVEAFSENATYAINADVSNADAVKGLGIEEVDALVVAMGSDLTASIMSVMVAKELGVPYVMAKASDERMGAILKKVGADKVLFPEEESGARTARILVSESFMDYFDIDENLCMLEMKAKPEWVGKNLMELNLRKKYKLNVVAIKNNKKKHLFVDPEKPLQKETELLIVVDKMDLKKLNS